MDTINNILPVGSSSLSFLYFLYSYHNAINNKKLFSLYPRFAFGWSPLRALVHGRHKYIEAPRPELYDLESDPAEVHDLWSDRTKQAERLAAMLRARTEGDTAAAPQPDPEHAGQLRRLDAST